MLHIGRQISRESHCEKSQELYFKHTMNIMVVEFVIILRRKYPRKCTQKQAHTSNQENKYHILPYIKSPHIRPRKELRDAVKGYEILIKSTGKDSMIWSFKRNVG